MIQRCLALADSRDHLRLFFWTGRAVLCGLTFVAVAAGGEQPLRTSLFVINRGGSGLRHVVHVDGFPTLESPRWSHDGLRLAFSAAPAGDEPARMFVVNVDGSALGELGQGTFPCWSPDDKQIAFFDAHGRKPGTSVQNLDGRGRQWLSAGRAACWSHDGGRIALENHGSLVVFDLIEGVERGVFGRPMPQSVSGFDWSPDGKRLATVVQGGPLVEVWLVDTATNNEAKLRYAGSLGGHVSWSPDGEYLAIDEDSEIRLLSVAGDAPPEAIAGQRDNNRMPAWSPDGKTLAFVSDRPASEVAEAPTSSRKWQFEEVTRFRKGSIVYSLAYSPDGRRVVLGGDPVNQGVHLLDLASGEITNLGGRGIRVVMFPDGRRFATSWHSPLIQIVDIDTHDVVREVSHGGANVRTFALSPDGQRIVSGGLDNLMHVWDVNSGELLLSFNEHRDWITQVAFAPDGDEIISADHGKSVRVWNARSGKQRLELKHPAVAWGLAVSPDGRHILTGSGGPVATSPQALKIVPGDDNSLRLWDAADGRLVREMKGHTEAAYSVDISPDGRLAASAGWDGNICLWDLQTGERLDLVNDRQGRAAEVVFSPDGRHVMVGGGGRRFDRQIVEFPEEQLRLYRLVEQTPKGNASQRDPENGP